jgi:hypothetical protein
MPSTPKSSVTSHLTTNERRTYSSTERGNGRAAVVRRIDDARWKYRGPNARVD